MAEDRISQESADVGGAVGSEHKVNLRNADGSVETIRKFRC